jgi:hypothetical protein
MGGPTTRPWTMFWTRQAGAASGQAWSTLVSAPRAHTIERFEDRMLGRVRSTLMGWVRLVKFVSRPLLELTVLTLIFFFKRKGPWGQNLSKESQNIQRGRLTKVAINQVRWRHHLKRMGPINRDWIKKTSSFQGTGPYRKDQQDMEREDMSDFIEGKDWGPSYHKFGGFVFFSKFEDRSYSTRIRSQASSIYWTRAIVIDISYRSTKSSTFTFWLRPPLRSRSRVDFDEFFGQAGLHRTTWPLSCSWVFVMTYIVTCKAATDYWFLASRDIS